MTDPVDGELGRAEELNAAVHALLHAATDDDREHARQRLLELTVEG